MTQLTSLYPCCIRKCRGGKTISICSHCNELVNNPSIVRHPETRIFHWDQITIVGFCVRDAMRDSYHVSVIVHCVILKPGAVVRSDVRPPCMRTVADGSSVWDPSSILLQEELEKVQKRAARFVTGNYLYETGSMTGILEQLKWESLKKRRRDSRIIMLYKGLKGAASIPTNDLVPPIRHVRNHHSLAFQTPFANTDIYKCSFFPQTIRDWNSLTDTFLSAAEGAEDSVAKFTSLVRARD